MFFLVCKKEPWQVESKNYWKTKKTMNNRRNALYIYTNQQLSGVKQIHWHRMYMLQEIL